MYVDVCADMHVDVDVVVYDDEHMYVCVCIDMHVKKEKTVAVV